MNNFLNNLKQRRKVALRMGFFADEEMNYVFSAETVKKLCKKSITIYIISLRFRHGGEKITNLC